jgi:hypothetical protein
VLAVLADLVILEVFLEVQDVLSPESADVAVH